MATLTFIRHSDGTATLKSGRKRVVVDIRDKTHEEAMTYIRWAAMGIGITLNPQMQAYIEESLRIPWSKT